ncbi:hypothetical protein G6F32_014841 [Rhizopus arrhizus]|nr:hypothetical protein G6F32_014841 [Rhizopus arrhizus]
MAIGVTELTAAGREVENYTQLAAAADRAVPARTGGRPGRHLGPGRDQPGPGASLRRAAGAGPLVQAAGPHAVRAGAPRGAAARRQRGRRGDRDRDLLVVGQQRVFPGGTARAGRLVPRIRRADRARAPAAH